ncbi:MAG: methyltransferase domain-containing protein [bacterium]|nr:methyltransferase domain-containing protein [bacterium]
MHLENTGGPLAHPGHELNRIWWDEVTPVHAGSEFYDMDGFLKGKTALDRLELDWLGDVAGKRVLHLQCHFGKSTIDIARRGAAQVVGVDFSPVAIKTARDLAVKTGVADRVSFIESDVLKLDSVLSEKFDIVFTSYGVLTWLSNLHRWAEIVAKMLSSNGKFVIVECHPTMMMFEWKNGKIEHKFGYFHCEEGIVIPPMPDYADRNYTPVNETREWQWSLADVFRVLTKAGLRVTQFEEYPTCCFAPFQNMIECGDDLYRLPDGEPSMPMTFAMEARF